MAHRPLPRRAFGFWICLALVIGNMIGSGVFALPGALAPFGWNAGIGWLFDPTRNIPRATMAGTLITGLVYIVTVTGVALLLPRALAVHSNAPFADFIGRHWGGGPASLVALFAAIGALGALNGWVLLQGEIPFATARDGVFPRWLAATSAPGTPIRAQLVSSGVVTLLLLAAQSPSLVGLIIFMALVSTIASLVAYRACAAAALRLLRAGRLESSPLLIACCCLGLFYSLWAVYGAGLKPAA